MGVASCDSCTLIDGQSRINNTTPCTRCLHRDCVCVAMPQSPSSWGLCHACKCHKTAFSARILTSRCVIMSGCCGSDLMNFEKSAGKQQTFRNFVAGVCDEGGATPAVFCGSTIRRGVGKRSLLALSLRDASIVQAACTIDRGGATLWWVFVNARTHIKSCHQW